MYFQGLCKTIIGSASLSPFLTRAPPLSWQVSTTASRLKKTKKNDNGVALEKPTTQACGGEEDLSYAYESEFESDSDSPTD